MKSVLISIQPKWVEKICSGEKTIEVRKTRPKIETPFKCYIYCSYGNDRENYMLSKRGKVIGEFVCDKVYNIEPIFSFYYSYSGYDDSDDSCYFEDYSIDKEVLEKTCLTKEDLYIYGNGKTLYGWHISDLKIYDKPKELSEFRKPFTPKKLDIRKFIIKNGINNIAPDFKSRCDFCDKITRPPQSWCYVEELK